MRRILAGGLGLVVLFGAANAPAQEPQWRAVAIGAPVADVPPRSPNRPAVSLGAPVAVLGAPQPVRPAAARTAYAEPARLTSLARGQAEDRTPMPLGAGTPAGNQPAPLPPPTPLPTVPTDTAPGATAPFGPFVVGGPVAVGPVPYENFVPGGGIGLDPGFAPLPGGAFVPEAAPAGMIIYGNFEYLLWWIRDAQLPPLLTASNAASFGVIGVGDTRVIFGDGPIAGQERSGGRFTVGGWFCRCQNWGWEGSYFFLGEKNSDHAFANPGTGVLARPFLLPDGRETSELISFPNTFAGGFAATTSNTLWGADINLKNNLWAGCRSRLDLLGGFRYLHFDEELRIGESFNALPTVTDPRFAGARGLVLDNFKVNNDFYGGQLGLNGELRRGPWSLNVWSKVALGRTHETVEITGGQLITQGGRTQMFSGLLTQPTNTGRFSRDKFAVVPEVGLNVGWQATPHVKCFVGYNFLYWSDVLRAGDQVDRVINTPALPGSNPVRPATFPIQQLAAAPFRPTVLFRDTDFWAQGINFGLQLSW
jgi:Putative beta barrel porin-7 (BBP7)